MTDPHADDELIHNIQPNAKCPLCNADMRIAGRWPKEPQMHDGKTIPNQYECLQCGKKVTPKGLS